MACIHKLTLILILAFFALPTLEAKNKIDEEVILEMADGTTIRAWFRSDMVDIVKYIEVSDTPNGERVRYENDQIKRITFLPPNANYIITTYTKTDLFTKVKGKGLKEARWVREDYKGNGIVLYSTLNTASRPVAVGSGSGIGSVNERKFYITIGDGPAQWVSEDAPNIINQKSANRTMLVMFFKTGYPEFAARIKSKEFETKSSPIQVVKAWEETYGNK